MPNFERSLATLRSQAQASSSPAPSAQPSMRAMTGTGRRRTHVAAAMHHRYEVACAGVVESGDLADIGAADKRALAGTCQDRQPQSGVGGEPGNSFDDFAHQRPI